MMANAVPQIMSAIIKAMASLSNDDHYRKLPAKRMAAGLLIRNSTGRVFSVKPHIRITGKFLVGL